MTTAAPRFIFLHSLHSSVVLECPPNAAPIWRYWGARLQNGATPPAMLQSLRPPPPASLENFQSLTLAPTFGAGWFGRAALLAHRDGQAFVQDWQTCSIEELADNKIVVTLHDAIAAIKLCITISLNVETDVMTISTSLQNMGDGTLQVDWLAAATLPMPAEAQIVESHFGEWANEFQVQQDRLSRSTWLRENVRGRTSHDTFPAAAIICEGATQHKGHVYGAQLAWSGNHVQAIEWQHDGTYQWQLGEWLAPGEMRLAAGEMMTCPIVTAAFSSHGLNGLAQRFHASIRQQLPWKKLTPRPVHINTWEAVYFDHNEADLKSLATSAAALGVERFVLDDGWFHGRNHDRAGLGDWWADSQKYPDGLLPLAKHVTALGITFGLWVEPEMVNPDSELYRAHPDWVLHIDGRTPITGRNQLVLNLSRADVSDYLFDQLQQLLSTLPISYLKWDMNRDLAHAATNGGAAYRRQVIALYQLLQRVNDAFPDVEIESCASGGGRADAGILQFCHRVWTSDCNDALSRVAIQRGALQWLPPEIMGAHVGAAPAHTTGRSQSLAFRAAVAIGGHFGLEMDVRKLTATERTTLNGWIGLYKKIRHQLHGTTLWRGDAGDGVAWQAHGDASAIILLIYRLTPTTQRFSPTIKLPMLDHSRRYQIVRLDATSTNHSSAIQNDTPSFFDQLNQHGVAVDGDWLIQHGLALPRQLAETAMILELTTIDV